MKQEVIQTENGWIIKIPIRQIQMLQDWKFTVLMEIALMMAKPEDFMSREERESPYKKNYTPTMDCDAGI